MCDRWSATGSFWSDRRCFAIAGRPIGSGPRLVLMPDRCTLWPDGEVLAPTPVVKTVSCLGTLLDRSPAQTIGRGQGVDDESGARARIADHQDVSHVGGGAESAVPS